jgi:hypothetical protein
MTTEEFSNEFDVLLNSYNQSLPFGASNDLTIALDEYEKSVFLTKAQRELVISLYNGNNQENNSFEKTEEIRRYLEPLVKTTILNEDPNHLGVSDNSTFFKLPNDLLFITYESAYFDYSDCNTSTGVDVVATTQNDFQKTNRNPFRGPSKRRVIRLDAGGGLIELVSTKSIQRYLVRYLSNPTPIILNDFPDNISIEGENIKTECKLNPVLHKKILENAVALAIASKTYKNSNTGNKNV